MNGPSPAHVGGPRSVSGVGRCSTARAALPGQRQELVKHKGHFNIQGQTAGTPEASGVKRGCLTSALTRWRGSRAGDGVSAG